MDNELQSDVRGPSALEKVRLVSQALSDAARRTRISSRSRRSYAGGGFQARRGAAAMRWAILLGFYVMVVIPSVAAIVYYGFVASDQYVAVADFTVGGGEPVPVDGLAAMTGIPAAAIIQDTQIVVNYLESRAAVERLEKMVDIRALYSTPTADALSRFKADKPIEKFVAYWKKMVTASIKMPAGSVELRVRAFTPDDAARIAQAALTICEQLINEMNDRMTSDAVSNAEEELNRSTARLTQSQVSFEQARNDQGMLDATKAADAVNKLINTTRSALLGLQQQYTTQIRFVSETAPQSLALKSRIDATTAQIRELEAQLTTAGGDTKQPTLAGSMTKFSELELEDKVAQRLYTSASAALEAARLIAERKMMYLNTFVKPVAPEEAEYPKRGLQILLVIGGCLALWGACCGLALTVRNHMA